MAYIKLKDGKQIRLTPEKANKLDDLYKRPSTKPEQTFSVDGTTFTKAMIAYVSTSDEEDASQARKSEASIRMKEMVKRQHDEFEKILALSPEERAQDTRFFSFYFFTLTMRNPTEEETGQAKTAQLAYFAEHDTVYAHPKIFHPVVMAGNPDRHVGSYQSELSGAVGNLFSIASRYVRRSEYAATKRLESYE